MNIRELSLWLLMMTLFACSHTPVPQTPRTPSENIITNDEIANQFLVFFQRNARLEDFLIAEQFAERAYRQCPDDINAQKVFYRVQYTRTLLDNTQGVDALNTLYLSLDPNLAPQLPPPRTLDVFQPRGESSPQSNHRHLLAAITANPFYARYWYELSQELQKQGLVDAAILPAERALTLNSGRAEHQVQVSRAHFKSSFAGPCASPAALKQVQQQLLKALTATPSESELWQRSAEFFLRLDQPQLAYQHALRAQQLKPNADTLYTLMQSEYWLDHTVKTAADLAPATQLQSPRSSALLAALAIESRHWDEAKNHLQHYSNDMPLTANSIATIDQFNRWLSTATTAELPLTFSLRTPADNQSFCQTPSAKFETAEVYWQQHLDLLTVLLAFKRSSETIPSKTIQRRETSRVIAE